MNIATVVEGPTDRLVLTEVLRRIFPGEHRFFPLQPPSTFGELGTGWKGVRRWCQQVMRFPDGIHTLLSGDTGSPLDMLVVHIDADIAQEHDLQEGVDNPVALPAVLCPPISLTTDFLGQVVNDWLGSQPSLEPRVVLAMPAQDMENWVFAALYPQDKLCQSPDFECTHQGSSHPAYLLTLNRYGKWLRRTDGTIKKSERAYMDVAPQVAASWENACAICSQAQAFDDGVRNLAQAMAAD